jgi:hypothetical protein
MLKALTFKAREECSAVVKVRKYDEVMRTELKVCIKTFEFEN